MNVSMSAKRTNENSPAIYRWEYQQNLVASPRSGQQNLRLHQRLWIFSFARFTGSVFSFKTHFPALKCWAIVGRPLRGLCAFAAAISSITIVGITASAQPAQRKPSEATRPFVVMSAQSLDDLQKTLQPDNKTSELIDSGGMQLRVAVQHEKNRTGAAAELHDASDDVYYVLDGSATLVLGGKLDSPKETDPGEWRSPRIIDGKTIEIKKGDVVIVPRGTPHQRSTENKDFTMLLIKIYAEPLKKKP
jgi:mannose-6-phosphate isomerase-like protein (cupin superfamily)